VYDTTGMSSNDQQGADINYEGFTGFKDAFRDTFTNEVNHKTYEQVLEEYEKFFSLEQEMQ
jgi:hypothetical protein